MEPIKITKKDIYEWQPVDFVLFFKDRYAEWYNGEELQLDFGKDCMIMKRIIYRFRKNNRGKLTVKRFIDWVFQEYDKRKIEFTPRLTIGFLPFWVDEYLGIKSEQNKKKTKKSKIELSNETKKWLEEQKKSYMEDQNADSSRS